MHYQASKESLDTHRIPQWYSDAKFGIFIHWGLYSLPAFAERNPSYNFQSFMHDLMDLQDCGGRIPYAEWYLNALRIPGSATARYHEATYGKDVPYTAFQKPFEDYARSVDFGQWAEFFRIVGAKYVVMVTKHLDGYTLWPTQIKHPRRKDTYGSREDLVGKVTSAVRARGLKMGVYYSGGTDWTCIDKPIRTLPDFMEHQALGKTYREYATAQWLELIERYQPSLLWNDMGFPSGPDLNALFAHYYNTIEDGLVNDRWSQINMPANPIARAIYLRYITFALNMLKASGKALPETKITFHYDLKTQEYSPLTEISTRSWELTRGLGNSFGYNAQEIAADMLTGRELIHMLADVVSKNGNLLINVGPKGDGSIPDMQKRPLLELGEWLKGNGEAIYETRSWIRSEGTTLENKPVRFTQKDDCLYAIIIDECIGECLTITDVPIQDTSSIHLLGSDVGNLRWERNEGGVRITLPHAIPQQCAYTFKITHM
jgi:alpha-L-fucosidase